MARVTVRDEDIELDSPYLIEGLPGVGLVGKIAADHLVDALDMTYYASVHCEGLPRVGVYRDDERDLLPPVRFYADAETNVVVLESDVPVSRTGAAEFATCISSWLLEHDVTPLFLSGIPLENPTDPRALYGVSTGDTGSRLDDLDIAKPTEPGMVGGPTGALLHRAAELEMSSIGLIVESDKQFPDPAAARVVIADGIMPITGIDVEVASLTEQAEDIKHQKEQLAKQMQQAEEHESSQARPLRMFQ